MNLHEKLSQSHDVLLYLVIPLADAYFQSEKSGRFHCSLLSRQLTAYAMEPLLLRNVNSTKTFLEFTGKKKLAFNMKYNVLLLTMFGTNSPI